MSLKLNSNSINYNVATVLDLTSIVNPSINDTVVVTEEGRGGVFIYRADGTSNGGTIFDSSGAGKWHRQYEGSVNVKWFGASETRSDNQIPINNALDVSYNVFMPNGVYYTNAPIEVPVLVSLYGESNGTVIKPVFSSWVGTDYRAIVLETKEGINYNNRDFGKVIKNFMIEGVDSNLVSAIALDFRTKTPNLCTSTTVNFSLVSTFISEITINRFDTAINIFELWCSSISKIFINECRKGINIEGQAVNNMINHIQATNFTNTYTSSTANTIGIYITSSNRYNGVEHRPEGFVFDSCLIYGAYYNVYMYSCLAFKMDKMILDGGSNICVYIVDPADFTLSNSYIYTSHTTYVQFAGISDAQTDSVRLLNNNFIGKSLSDVGIYFIDSGVRRINVTISNNSFYNFGYAINATQCPEYSFIINNTLTGSLAFTINHNFITIQNGGTKTLIDGNRTRENVSILWTHPAVTSPLLSIGDNSSLNQTTKKTGIVTIPAGSTTVDVPVGWTNTDQYVRFFISASCNQITSFKYTPQTSWMDGTITIPSALASNAVFRYTTTAVPYTANL